MQKHPWQEALSKDASLAEIFSLFLGLIRSMGKHKRKLLIWPLVFGLPALAIGLLISKDEYKAEYIIAAEEETASGFEGLMAQFGLDAGSSNPGGVFQGESLVRLFTTRKMIERALLSEADYHGKQIILAEAFFAQTKHAKKKAFKDVVFDVEREQQKPLADSALYLTYKYVKQDILGVNKPDKKQSFINVTCVNEDRDLATALSTAIIQTVTDFYIESMTKKARLNLDVLRLEADSVQRVLNENLSNSAEISDLNINPIKQTMRVSQNRSIIDLQISVSLFGEITKNLKLAEISLRKQTPLIQIIEEPQYPLEKVGYKWWQLGMLGFVLGIGFAMYLIYVAEKTRV